MSYPIKADVRAVLEKYHPRIRQVVELAWDEWRAVANFRTKAGYGSVMYSRTVANYIFDAIARYAIAEFAADASVHIEIEAQTIKLFFRDGVVARFKKGDDNKLGRNVVTQAVLAFIDPDETLPGFPESTAKVEFIWLANDIHTRLEHVLVVARDNEVLIWDYEIEGEAGGAVVPFPSAPIQPDDSDVDRLVTPKTTPSKKPENEE